MIGLSSLAGAHMYLFPRVLELLRERGVEDVAVIGGGIVPDDDITVLREAGMKAIFIATPPLRSEALQPHNDPLTE